MQMKTFREACCERFGISPEAFEEEVLWRCCYHRAMLLGTLIRHVNQRYYDLDLELIRQIADCTTVGEMRAEMTEFRYHHPIRGYLRKVLRIRLSGQRLVDLGAKLLPENSHPEGDAHPGD
jgi:hypothetical protein